MTVTRAIIFFGILLIGCKNNQTKVEVDSTWVEHHLPHGWAISTPPNFNIGELQGIDSQVGYISSGYDSVLLNYDTVSDMALENNDCNFSTQYEKARHIILNEKQYQSTFQIDSIDGKPAIIETPGITGNGEISLSIRDCNSGAWLGINGKNFNSEREKLVLAIFQTIEFDN